MDGAYERIPGAPRIAVESAGEGPLVLFMHGIGGNRTNWRDQLGPFSLRYRPVTWDARGYGDSDDYEGPLDFADFGSDVVRVLDHFGVERAHLVGLSMGGRIALDVIERFPERVSSLVLCDTFPGFASLSAEQREEFVRSRRDPLEAGKELRDIAPPVAKTLVSPTAAPDIVQRLVDSMCALHKESYVKTIEGMVYYPKSADLEAIRVPSLVLVGEDDRLTPPALSESMAARIPGARLARLENAGHLTNLERPEAFNEVVLGFLDGLPD